ncbi:MAG: UDP-N-acetylmuramyl-tripeptide synthetase [Nannocystaceae bacterium]
MAADIQLGELLDGLEVSYVGCDPRALAPRITTREDEVKPGEFLFALPVPCDQMKKRTRPVAHDGVVITDRTVALREGQPVVYLERPVESLGVLSERILGFPAAQLKIGAVTGTNGKTTTSWLVAAMLAAAGREHTRMGTIGHSVVGHASDDDFTTPPAYLLQEILADTVARGGRYVVMEASSQGLLEGRLWPLKLDAIAMTNLGSDHLDLHKTVDAYREAKLLLARQHLRPGGTAVAVVDDDAPACASFLEIARSQGAAAVWRVSTTPGADGDIRVLRALEPLHPGHWRVEVETPLGSCDLIVPLEGRFNLANALTAIGLGIGLGLNLDEMRAGLAEAGPPPGRVAWVSEPGPDRVGVVIDSAQCPHSLAHVLPVARARASGSLLVVTGCGGNRDSTKRPVIGRLVAGLADRFYATCNNIRHEDPNVILADTLAGLSAEELRRVSPDIDRRASIRRAIADARPGDVVLIAGLGGQDYQTIGAERVPLDEAEIAREALASR